MCLPVMLGCMRSLLAGGSSLTIRRLRAIAAALDAEQLAASPSGMEQSWVRFRIVHALHDEANHGGEIWLLRKMQNASKG